MVQVLQTPRSRVEMFAGQIKPVTLAIGLALGIGVGTAPAASAATITVNNLSGTSVAGQCTLRDAVVAARTNAAVQGCAAGSGADTINFSVTGTISLATQIVVDSDVTISGPGAASLTLAPSGTNRALYINDSNPTVTISGITFQGNGTSTEDGAALYNYAGALTIQNCVFSGNVTTGKGGAIYNYSGNLTIQNSVFTGNRATNGGAIYNYGGAVDIQSSTFSANRSSAEGGAIYMYDGTLTIRASTFSGNIATGKGGAIYLYGSQALTLSDSTLSGNQASSGGAIYFYSAAASTITNSTISGNSSTGDGGAIVLYGQVLTVRNSTFSGNTAGGSGGAFYLTDASGSVLTLVSTIVANSTSTGGNLDIARATGTGTVNATNSLIFNPGTSINGTNVANITGQNPLLGALANNGGLTQTQALLAGSPALNTGSNPLGLPFDQRGAGFARSSSQTDIGAFEVQGAGPPPPTATAVIPTLSQWGLVLLSTLMAGWAMITGFGRRRRR